MKTKPTLADRYEALKKAHPDMIWGFCYSDEEVCIKCICPKSYSRYGDRIYLGDCVVIVGEVRPQFFDAQSFTVTGGKRILTRLERMDWTKFDGMAKKAREQLASIEKEVAP